MKVRIFLAFVPFVCVCFFEMNQVSPVRTQELHNHLHFRLTSKLLIELINILSYLEIDC